MNSEDMSLLQQHLATIVEFRRAIALEHAAAAYAAEQFDPGCDPPEDGYAVDSAGNYTD